MNATSKFLLGLALCAQTLGCGAPEEPAAPEPALGQAAQALSTPNVLQNPDFKIVGPSGPSTSITTVAPGGAGNSAAASWTLFTNTPGYIGTWLSPSTRPGSSNNMIHVRTLGNRNGLVQVFGALNSGYTHAVGSAWIYIVSGSVGIGTGNGGNTGIDRNLTTTGAWVNVKAINGVIPANEFVIYSTSTGGADFFVDYGSVQNSPNLLQNATFATVGPSGPSTSVTTLVPGGAGNSAAASWTLFTNTPGPISTQLLPSTFPGTTRMIRVQTPGDRDGLVQVTGPFNSGPARTAVEAYVYLYSGRVGIGAGNGGNTSVSTSTNVLGSWQLLKGVSLNTPVNEFVIYSVGGPATFDVAFATTYEIP